MPGAGMGHAGLPSSEEGLVSWLTAMSMRASEKPRWASSPRQSEREKKSYQKTQTETGERV
jgi:hypothetical protein